MYKQRATMLGKKLGQVGSIEGLWSDIQSFQLNRV